MHPTRRRWVVSGLVVVLLVGLAVQGAAVAGVGAVRQSPGTLTVSDATVNAKWRQGWLRPGAVVRVAGSVEGPATLTAILRPKARPGVVTLRKVFENVNGPFVLSLKLPPRPLPGAYGLRVLGTTAAGKIAPVDRTVRVPAPPEGVLNRALVSTTDHGPWLAYRDNKPPVVRGSHKQIWMRFRFLYPPSGRDVELVWKYKWHRVIGRIQRRYKNRIDAFVKSDAPLPKGHWVVVLKVDQRIAKQMDVILRGT